jgi:guanine deaminase
MNQKQSQIMQEAIEEAFKGMKNNEGGPFGAVIVKENKILARAHNEVLRSNDPTAHAELLAIRRAAKKLKRFDLSDCEIYSTCEPCPMCMGAILWARIKKLYYGCNRTDAGEIGFSDKTIYDFFEGKENNIFFSHLQINREACLPLFRFWHNKEDKIQY